VKALSPCWRSEGANCKHVEQCRFQNTFAGLCKSIFGRGRRAGEGGGAVVRRVLR
jgi:hypothetical protein